MSLSCVQIGHAETLDSALVRAYTGNPRLNSGRAGLRSTDEFVAIAKAGYRPRVAASSVVGFTYSEAGLRNPAVLGGQLATFQAGQGFNFTQGAGLNVSQVLFNGFVTDNQVRQAESNVFATRETLRMSEAATLFGAAQAYMDVLQNTASVELQRNFVVVLQEQVRQTIDRFRVGEVTRTDVSQSESRLAGARYQVSSAEAVLQASISIYRQVIGVEPRTLAPGRPIDRYVPNNLDAAIAIGSVEHPRILSSLHSLDAAESQVKILEGNLYPRASLNGAFQRSRDISLSGNPGSNSTVGTINGNLNIPLYQGGSEYAQIRAAKELVTRSRMSVEAERDTVRADIIRAWGLLEAAKAQIAAFQAQVQANEIALVHVREEASVGQRTTLDVLNAQQELLSARNNLISAQRNRVVQTYDVIQAIGRLSTQLIRLNNPRYEVKTHLDQIRNLWAGLRTADGR